MNLKETVLAAEINLSKPRLAIFSWALYDLANTLFSFNIVSIHFALWVVNDMNGSDSHYGFANAISMLLVLLTAPLLGAISDQTKRRIPFLILTTCLCVLFTLLLGHGGLSTSLLVFVVANYMFQSGLIFYDALLPAVSKDTNRGKIGAFGVGLGYMGSLIGAAMGIFLLEALGRVAIFKLTALLFMVFSVPCFFFVKEQKSSKLRIGIDTVRDSFLQLKHTFAKAKEFPGLGRFLIGRVFYADAVNTCIIFMGIYVTNELGFTDQDVQILLAYAVIAAIIGAFIWGYLVDAVGPKKCLNMVLYLWVVVLAGIAAIPLLDLPTELMWVFSALAGIAMGGVWCADRPYLLRLAPQQYVGEFFGIYSMVGRFSSIAGPIIWVLVSETMGFGRPAAVLSLLLFVFISYFILQGVNDRPQKWEENILGVRPDPAGM